MDISNELNLLRKQYISTIEPINYSKISTKKHVEMSSPLRVNFSAGWNDTPPYCNEIAGYTLNAPILLNNKFPINVTINHIDEPQIVLENVETNTSTTINDIRILLDCMSPTCDFALVKSAILATGLFPIDFNYDMNLYFQKFGGFKISTSVNQIPVGSGLGTSSILLFACIKAIHTFIGIEVSEEKLIHLTTCAEQIMTTGGGYQDAIGSLNNGFNFISFKPKKPLPNISIKKIDLDKDFQNSLQSRLAYIYTGKTRIAKGLLQTIIGNYIKKDSKTLHTLEKIGDIALQMKYNLENKDLEAFSQNMIKSFDLNVQLNPNFTNNEIKTLLDILKPYITGYMLSGAGGGGFLTVILKENVSKEEINRVICTNLCSATAKIYPFNLLLG